MSNSIRDVKNRIKSVSSTEQIAFAMKTVAVSKYYKALAKYNNFRDYSNRTMALLNDLGGIGSSVFPVAHTAETAVCYVVVTANRGLCGSYNLEVVHKLDEILKEEKRQYSLIICGKWGTEFFKKNKADKIQKIYDIKDIPEYTQAEEISAFLQELYMSGKAAEINIVYQSYKNVMQQIPEEIRFLPGKTSERNIQIDNCLFVPDNESVLRSLAAKCLAVQIYNILLSASAGAHGSMLMAMRTAADNSAEMLADLKLQLNRLRQSAVTTEVLEISSSSGSGNSQD